jgi:hypothetical protein
MFYKTFYSCNWITEMFVTVSHFYLNAIFADKARSLPLEWSTIMSSTRVGSSLFYKYEVIYTDKNI